MDSNILSIPFKKTYTLPIRKTVREYLSSHHPDIHPDEFKWDIERWDTLRKESMAGIVHVDRIKRMESYHAQLIFILTKLPYDIGLEVAYAPMFNERALPVTLRNLIFERAGILFNLAALYSRLAIAEDRSTQLGVKQMIVHYQAAAGTLNYMISFVIPSLRSTVTEDDMPSDLTETLVGGLETLMLAQAQEGVWQRAVMDNYKNGVVAKLSAKVASLYEAALEKLKEASSSVSCQLPPGWLAHIEAKQLHFTGASQYRKSIDDLEANRYGHEIARLNLALAAVRKGYDVARKGSVGQSVQRDIKSLLEQVQQNSVRAERDNDLIYHHEVASASSLPSIVEVSMVQPQISGALSEPKTALGNDTVIFGELLGYGAKLAIEIYNDRRKNWLQEEVLDRSQHLDDAASNVLRSLNLPGALEALEKPIGLPPSILKKAEEVRSEDGPARIEASIENVQKMAQTNMRLLNEAMDILDQEAEEDEALQEGASGHRVPSSEANKELVAKAERYRHILKEAADSDEVVRGKWNEWERNITELTWDKADLEAAVPSSTVSLGSNRATRGQSSTQAHARQLRSLLESLDDIRRSRSQTVNRAKVRAESEDITPRILKAAAAIERWVEVQPSMFDDVLDEELSKYEKFRQDIEEGEQQQEVLLDSIKERNRLFIQSRKEDSSVREREHALQSLDLAYHKYKEITRNLDEGLKFYNDISAILTQFKETCKGWANQRRDEMHSLVQTLHSLSMQGNAEPARPDVPAEVPTAPPQTSTPGTKVVAQPLLPRRTQVPPSKPFMPPPPGSSDWEPLVLPPPPRRPGA